MSSSFPSCFGQCQSASWAQWLNDRHPEGQVCVVEGVLNEGDDDPRRRLQEVDGLYHLVKNICCHVENFKLGLGPVFLPLQICSYCFHAVDS